MINTSIYCDCNASDDDIVNCASNLEESDYYLCKACLNYSKCVGLAMKKLSNKLRENDNG